MVTEPGLRTLVERVVLERGNFELAAEKHTVHLEIYICEYIDLIAYSTAYMQQLATLTLPVRR